MSNNLDRNCLEHIYSCIFAVDNHSGYILQGHFFFKFYGKWEIQQLSLYHRKFLKPCLPKSGTIPKIHGNLTYLSRETILIFVLENSKLWIQPLVAWAKKMTTTLIQKLAKLTCALWTFKVLINSDQTTRKEHFLWCLLFVLYIFAGSLIFLCS